MSTTPSSSAAAPPFKRPPRGHKQKGAGTTVVSKGDVKRDGLEIKEWQKTPKQLLSEYCKAEKRPPPRYVPSSILGKSTGILLRVILPDPKDQKEKDISLVPKDVSFPTLHEAEHAAALLALAKLDGARAHEMKLPEPYKTIFLNTVGRKPPTSNNNATTSSVPAAAAEATFPCTLCAKVFSKSFALEQHTRKDHVAVSANVSTVPSIVKTTTNPKSVTTIATPVPIPSPPPTTTTASTITTPVIIDKLEATTFFKSNQERRLAMETTVAIQKKKLQHSHNNRHKGEEDEVFMNEENRIALEKIIRSASKLVDAHHHHHRHHVVDTMHKKDQDDEEYIVEKLVKLGFSKENSEIALKHASGHSVSSCLDYLLLHTEETDLPTRFDPRGQQLEVHRQQQVDDSYPQTLEEIKKWFASEKVDEREENDVEEDVDTLGAILGSDKVSLSVVEGEYSLCRIHVGQNAYLSTSELYVELFYCFPKCRMYCLISGLATNKLGWQVSAHVMEQARKQILPGEALGYFIVDYVRTMDKLPTTLLSTTTTTTTAATKKKSIGTTTATKKELSRTIQPRERDAIEKQSKVLLQHVSNRSKSRGSLSTVLPAQTFRQEILSAIRNHPVVIIKGDTGCGKTTQIPQFVFEDEILQGRGGSANIIITQPRRLAAISVAQRVCEEFGLGELGQEIGYRVQLDAKYSHGKTRMEFCTTGLLLKRLEFEHTGQDITHIFVDEIHERSLDSDFLLAILKHQVLTKHAHIKVILMSATMDSSLFSRYFNSAPILEIPGRAFPVQELFLSELPLKPLEDDAPVFDDKFGLNYSFLGRCIVRAHESLTFGSILVFVSGVNEINKTIASCQDHSDLLLIGLHGNSLHPQQAFSRPPPGKRKVIVCTNVCETSITIEDCVLVIDTGRYKEMRYDAESKISRLEEDWISLANARQRKGRAGRVQAGTCWRLYSKKRVLLDHAQAEVHRVPLEQICLSVAHHLSFDKSMTIPHFFSLLLEPPQHSAVSHAIQTLVDLNALNSHHHLTTLGRHLTKLPMDANLGKLLLFGALLEVSREIAIITAQLSRNKSCFTFEGKDNKLAFDRGAQSDHLTNLYAFEAFELAPGNKRDFCNEHQMDFNAMKETQLLAKEYESQVRRCLPWLNQSLGTTTNSLSEMSRRKRIKACLCILTPSVLRIKLPHKKYVQTASGAIQEEAHVRDVRFVPLISSHRNEDEDQSHPHTHEERILLHPSSVLSSTSAFYSNFLVYSSLMRTTRLFARDVTCVSPYGLLLFATSELTVDHERAMLVCDQGRMTFRCNSRIGVLVKEIKKLLDTLLQARLEDDSEEEEEVKVLSTLVLDACTKLIEGDGFNS